MYSLNSYYLFYKGGRKQKHYLKHYNYLYSSNFSAVNVIAGKKEDVNLDLKGIPA